MAAAILHTFMAGTIRRWIHILGEVEVIFVLWAAIFMLIFAAWGGFLNALTYLRALHFGEAIFVFVVMTLMSARPVLQATRRLIQAGADILPLPQSAAFYLVAMTAGPLLGSLITEPAAMTVTALLLLQGFYSAKISPAFKYATLGTLLVNISIGGTLTHYAAPPVLMVVKRWNWDLDYMFFNFGWKSVLAILCSNILVMTVFRDELKRLPAAAKAPGKFSLRQMAMDFLRLRDCKIKEAAWVGMFLAGLVILGGLQRWWLEPVLSGRTDLQFFTGAIGLTALVDNAALTYLAAQVSGLNETAKYLIVAGAVTGGGLTVIANAPNPAGCALLAPAFGKEGISAVKLFTGALIPTVIAALTFWFL